MSHKYACDDFRPVMADSPAGAAQAFAERLARRTYGRKGYCRNVRLDCWTESGTSHTFEVFIGYSVGQGTTSGHNEWLHVRRIGA